MSWRFCGAAAMRREDRRGGRAPMACRPPMSAMSCTDDASRVTESCAHSGWRRSSPTDGSLRRRRCLAVDDQQTTPPDKTQADRRLSLEDFEIQLEAARQSAKRGYYAVARAELRGAILFLNALEKPEGRECPRSRPNRR